MDKILTNAVWKMRNIDDHQDGIDVNVSFIPTGGTSYQLYVPSSGCKYACVMCNYGFEHPVRENEILEEVADICSNLPANIETLILESSGSFLDDRELPESLQISIMKIVAKTDVYRVQFETRYETVTPHKIQLIKELLGEHEIAFEFGVESINSEVLKIFNKDIIPEKLLETIWLLEENGMETSINIMVGAPLLTIKEQVEDAVNSVNWMLEKCPESTCAVLFPLNIKDFTLVKYWYEHGRYNLIPHWEFVEVLSKISKDSLDRIFISWYGNRVNEFHGRNRIIFPSCCYECERTLKDFYRDFVSDTSLEPKQKAVERICQAPYCTCRREYEARKETETDTRQLDIRLKNEKANLQREMKEIL